MLANGTLRLSVTLLGALYSDFTHQRISQRNRITVTAIEVMSSSSSTHGIVWILHSDVICLGIPFRATTLDS